MNDERIGDIGRRVGVPKKIWMLWFNGMDAAPDLVKRCQESWVAQNPEWEVLTLDGLTLKDCSEIRFDGHLAGLPAPNKSVLVRMDLLSRHGGVWADATTYCTKPLDDWLPEVTRSGFFAFERPGRDRLLANWFLASEPHHVLVDELLPTLLDYWRNNALDGPDMLGKMVNRLLRRNDRWTRYWFSPFVRDWLRVRPYYASHYLFAELLRNNIECAHAWSKTPKLSATGPLGLLRGLVPKPLTPQLTEEIRKRQVPVYKLNWRLENVPKGTALEYLFAQKAEPPSR